VLVLELVGATTYSHVVVVFGLAAAVGRHERGKVVVRAVGTANRTALVAIVTDIVGWVVVWWWLLLLLLLLHEITVAEGIDKGVEQLLGLVFGLAAIVHLGRNIVYHININCFLFNYAIG
jgi:hypothetical protein